MASETRLPLIGNVKRPYLWIGGIGIGVLGFIWYYRHQQNQASQAASTTASTDATSSYDPNAIDPSTGMTYAQEASGSLGSFPYGGVSDYGGSYYGTGNIVGYDQYGNPVYSTGITGNQAYTTNSEWATAAENDAATIGIDTATAATAISKILAGLPVTIQQQDLFMQLVGLDGQPPQGYPKPIKLVTTPSQSNPPSTSNVKVPNVVGLGYGNAYNILVGSGFKVTPLHVNSAWRVTSQSPPGDGRSAAKGSTVKLTVQAEKALIT